MNTIYKFALSVQDGNYSQFTIDWVEDNLLEDELPDDVKYQIENILAIMRPELLDYYYFMKLLKEI